MPTSVSTLPTTANPASNCMANVRGASESPRICSSVLRFSTATVGFTARNSRWTAAITERGAAAVRTHQVLGKRACLPKGKINLGIARACEVVGAAIGHYAHYFRGRLLRPAQPEFLTDGLRVPEVAIRPSLGHDGYAGRFAVIGRTEGPPIQNGQPQKVEVVLGDGPQRHRY